MASESAFMPCVVFLSVVAPCERTLGLVNSIQSNNDFSCFKNTSSE
jgi:hypothetical protein